MTTTLNASTAGAGGFIATGDNSGSLALQTAGTTAVTIDTSQNVGIGTATPSNAKLNSIGADSAPQLNLYSNSSGSLGANFTYKTSSGDLYMATNGYNSSSAPQAVLTASGRLLVGKTAAGDFTAGVEFQPSGVVLSYRTGNVSAIFGRSNDGETVRFYNVTSTVGSISTTSSSTAYNTSSDYRLKENIAPMTGALAKVAQLKPVTYKWKVDGSDGEGFIAHELAEVKPDCVSGDKDAIDAYGNPVYQGIDTSFLVATLTAAIQELKAINDTQTETINALTARIVALESRGTV